MNDSSFFFKAQFLELISKIFPPPPSSSSSSSSRIQSISFQNDAPIVKSVKKNPFEALFSLIPPSSPQSSPPQSDPIKPNQIFHSSTLAPIRPTLIPLEEEPLLKIFPKKTRNSVSRDSNGGNPFSALSGAFPKSSSPFLRITENFGKNFFPMLDELNEYTGPNAKTAITGVSGLPQPEQSDSSQTGSSADFLNAHNLMTAFLKATSKNPENDLKPMPIIYDGTEAGRNRPLMGQLFEADILLTSKQMKA